MVPRPRRPRRRRPIGAPPPSPAVRALVVAVLAAAAGTACSGGDPDPTCPPVAEAPAAELALLPPGLSFDGIGPVTRVASADGHLTVRAVSDAPLDELTVQLQDAVTAAGYRPAGMDNEGFEAEVFFTAGQYAAGQALVRDAGCGSRWDVDLVLVDPSAVPSTTPSAPAPSAVPPSPSAASSAAPTSAPATPTP